MAEPKVTTFKTMCFTLNNPTAEEQGCIMTFFESELVKRAVFQLEQGELETPHFQGYFALEKPMKFKTIKETEGFERCHFEKAKGDAKSNLHYCTKPLVGCTCKDCVDAAGCRLDGPWVYPNYAAFPKIGERSDLKDLYKDIHTGMTLNDIADKYPSQWLRMANHIVNEYNRYHLLQKTLKFKPLFVTYFYGESGSNKSRYAKEIAEKEYGAANVYLFNLPANGTVWWDDYLGQKCAILNEFNGQIDITTFNRLIDGEISILPVKGAHVLNQIERLIITSNHSWADIWLKTYAKNPELAQSVYRRLDQVVKFELDKEPVIEKERPKRVDDGLTLPDIAFTGEVVGDERQDIDFVERYKSKKRKLNDLEGDTVIGSDGEAMSKSYASNPANFPKKRKTQEDEDEDG